MTSKHWKYAAYKAAWYRANRARILAERQTPAYKDANREILKARNAAYYIANKDRLKKYVMQWQAKNMTRTLSYKSKSRKKYRVRDRPLYRMYDAKRRAAKYQATPKWANHFFIEEAYKLAALRTKMLGYPWHVDHIVPLRSKLVCGLHTHTNLRVIPGIENQRKNNRYWPDGPCDTAKTLNLE